NPVVTGPGSAEDAADADPAERVARNDVALGGVAHSVPIGADEVLSGPTAKGHPLPAIAQGGGSGRIGADEVPGHRVQTRPGIRDPAAGERVSGDTVACGDTGPAVAIGPDPVGLGSAVDDPTGPAVGQTGRPGRVGPDPVAGDAVLVAPGTANLKAVPDIA